MPTAREPPATEEACASCRAFLPIADRPEHGFCRRFPPVGLAAASLRRFPVVTLDDWCCEYVKAKP